jgi:hypothetical protein
MFYISGSAASIAKISDKIQKENSDGMWKHFKWLIFM